MAFCLRSLTFVGVLADAVMKTSFLRFRPSSTSCHLGLISFVLKEIKLLQNQNNSELMPLNWFVEVLKKNYFSS